MAIATAATVVVTPAINSLFGPLPPDHAGIHLLTADEVANPQNHFEKKLTLRNHVVHALVVDNLASVAEKLGIPAEVHPATMAGKYPRGPMH